jgi:hypothetical protein
MPPSSKAELMTFIAIVFPPIDEASMILFSPAGMSDQKIAALTRKRKTIHKNCLAFIRFSFSRIAFLSSVQSQGQLTIG